MSCVCFVLRKTNKNTLLSAEKFRLLFSIPGNSVRNVLLQDAFSGSCSSLSYSTILKPQLQVFVKKKKIIKKRVETKPYQELLGVLENHHRLLKAKSRTLVEIAGSGKHHGSCNLPAYSYANGGIFNETFPMPARDIFQFPSITLTNPLPDKELILSGNDSQIQDSDLSDMCFPTTLFHEHEGADADLCDDDGSGLVSSVKTEPSVKQISRKQRKLLEVKKEKECEIRKKSDELNFYFSLLSYIDVCVHAGMIDNALKALKFYALRSARNNNLPKVDKVSLYNLLLHGFAGKGHLQQLKNVFDVMKTVKVKANLQSYAAYLECLARQKSFDESECRKVLELLELHNLKLDDIYHSCKFLGDQQEKVFQAIKMVKENFYPNPLKFPKDYECHLLRPLNEEKNHHHIHSPVVGAIGMEKLWDTFKEQMLREVNGSVAVKSVFKTNSRTEDVQFAREKLETCEKEWRKIVSRTFRHNLLNLKSRVHAQNSMQLYPYLVILDHECYIDIIMQEIRNLALASESYSPLMEMLYRNVGSKVMMKYIITMKQKFGFSEKMDILYREYMQYCINRDMVREENPREVWQRLITNHMEGPSLNYRFVHWPHDIQLGVGRFLYNIILHSIRLDLNVLKKNSKTEKHVPAFYSVFRHYNGYIMKEEIKPHPLLSRIYREASLEVMNFDTILVPMLSPPVPWTTPESGGFIFSYSQFVRLPSFARQQRFILAKTPVQQLYPSFDSLNSLALCPWIVNKPVLEVMLEVFNDKGSKLLDIPSPPSTQPLPFISSNMTDAEKSKVFKERETMKRKKAEMYGLWCDALYKLSIANHFRDHVFWFPHNMDFRGRVYPTPPHFNHLGNDPMRSLLLFAKGEPLGTKGLDWLKIHLINLTGFKKRESVEERLKYSEEILPDILDSADYPLTGKKWWQTSDKPWQTLACCKEIAKAIRSPDPEKYVCHFHVHQDGSCNGLQHYAALGRDWHGACEVNLHPASQPQDVYSGVATLVERERAKDAAAGNKTAQILEGHVKRKVIKQTVMTIVYGVTRYGARYQILRQLKDLDDFPEELMWKAAGYLTQKTFDSILEMFTAAKQIQIWFNDCAGFITKVTGKPVEWVTPLGFPIVQPYHKASAIRTTSLFGKQSSSINRFDMFQSPNTVKQKNAFPPNFIHSLDSSHMMLTAIFCQRERITFMSVHDCYWTHPNHVDIMNKVCREQFVALHSEPILEDLSKFFIRKFGVKDGMDMGNAEIQLNKTLAKIPEKGSFDLKSVLKSTYFFS